MRPLVGCRNVGVKGFQFSTIVPVEPLKMVIELFAAFFGASVPPPPPEQPATARVSAAVAATAALVIVNIWGYLDRRYRSGDTRACPAHREGPPLPGPLLSGLSLQCQERMSGRRSVRHFPTHAETRRIRMGRSSTGITVVCTG